MKFEFINRTPTIGTEVAIVTCNLAGECPPLIGQTIVQGLRSYRIVKSDRLLVQTCPWPPQPPVYQCELVIE